MKNKIITQYTIAIVFCAMLVSLFTTLTMSNQYKDVLFELNLQRFVAYAEKNIERYLSGDSIEKNMGAEGITALYFVDASSSEETLITTELENPHPLAWYRVLYQRKEDLVIPENNKTESYVVIEHENISFLVIGSNLYLNDKQEVINENLILLLILALLFTLFIGQRVSDTLVGPLNTMTSHIEVMKVEGIAHPIPDELLTINSEIGVFARAFEELRERVLSSLNDIRTLNDTLESRIQERTLELTHTNMELDQSIQALKKTQSQLVFTQKQLAVSELVRGVAHHMNTPLSNVKLCISYLEELGFSENQFNKETMYQLIESIKKSVDRSIKTVEKLKQVSVYEYADKNKKIQLKRFLLDMKIMASTLLMRMPELIVIHSQEEITIFTKPEMLSKILVELLENAFIHGKVSYEHPVEIELTQKDQNVILKVKNYGTTFDASQIDQIFNPFFTTSTHVENLGLGLHIAKNQVELLGGQIVCEILENETQFTILLPVEAFNG